MHTKQVGFVAPSFKVLLMAAVLVGVAFGAVLVSDARNSRLEVDKVLGALDVTPGMTLAEIGAGRGRLSIAVAARLAPTGRVFSTELSAQLRDAIRAAASEAGVDNMTVVDAAERSTNLPTDCCEAIFMRHVYHHLTAPAAVTSSIRNALKPGGLLLIVECEPGTSFGSVLGVSSPHGVARERLRDAVSAAGFAFIGFHDWPGNQMYGAVFRSTRSSA